MSDRPDPRAHGSIEIVRAVPKRLPALAGVLGRALASDPIFQCALGGSGTVEAISDMACTLYERATEAGMVWEGGDGAGVAVWVPPGGAGLLGAADQIEARHTSVGSVDDGSRQQMWDWLESYVTADVWYLEVLGVDPARQRKGVGSALTHHGLRRAAASGTAAFLETSVATNVPYYERFGFEVVEEGDAPNGGPHVWFMRCEPRADLS